MAVHAHPDDEATSTGGILARYGQEGIRTVLVTCTDGGCGDGPGGIKPDDPAFDREAVVAIRRRELQRSCELLGVHHFESLEYPDSGMMGWPQNDHPGSFWSTPVEVAAARLAALMERYQPQVVVTYNADGFYGHPDHIQAHRITMAAAAATGIPEKVYFTAVRRSDMAELGRRMAEMGVSFEEETGTGDGEGEASPGPRDEWGTPDHEVTTFVDVMDFADVKFDALLAHASQTDNLFFIRMGRQTFGQIMGSESFVRAIDRTNAPVPEDDLFAGLR
jgi:LmbE family N-acetylglucosaminyl deacetylase